jgi:hypothetical protein
MVAFLNRWLFLYPVTLLDISSTADLASRAGALTPYVRVRIESRNPWGISKRSVVLRPEP